jgi:hypothetical protein
MIDPKFLKGARELRDRWLEKLNSEPQLLIGNAKYEVARALGGPGVMQITGATPLLTDAA